MLLEVALTQAFRKMAPQDASGEAAVTTQESFITSTETGQVNRNACNS